MVEIRAGVVAAENASKKRKVKGPQGKKNKFKVQQESSDEYESDWQAQIDEEVEILDSIEVQMYPD